MSKDESRARIRSLPWKIFITLAASAATYAATAMTDQPETWALMLSAFVGGVTLVVQFLLDVEARQISVDAGLLAFERHQRELTQQLETSVKTELRRFNEASSLLAQIDSGPLARHLITDLLRHAADLDHSAPALAYRLAEAQISNASNFIKDLGRGREVTADGNGWPWTFALTDGVRETIHATSYSAHGDNEEGLWDDDGWLSDLGRHYLDLQTIAIQRGVAIRRTFVLETMSLAGHRDLREICEEQCRVGIEVRLIDAATATRIAAKHIPLVIYDRAVSFELTPSRFAGAHPGFIRTTLVLNPFQVHERFEMFQRLWGGAQQYESA